MHKASDWLCGVAWGDAHVPDHDEAAYGATRALIRALKPDYAVCMGDMWGASLIGKYASRTNPIIRMRSGQEIETARELNVWMFDAATEAEKHVVKSNHEDRVRKDIWEKLPELWTVKGIREGASIAELLGYNEAGAIYHEHHWMPRSWLMFKHGDHALAGGGNSGRREQRREGTSGASGHTHRLALTGVTLRSRTEWWCETGCLCKNPPDYRPGEIQDWQQGCVVFWLHRRKPQVRFDLCPIEDGKILWRGKVYE